MYFLLEYKNKARTLSGLFAASSNHLPKYQKELLYADGWRIVI